jgi:hypothetical protein
MLTEFAHGPADPEILIYTKSLRFALAASIPFRNAARGLVSVKPWANPRLAGQELAHKADHPSHRRPVQRIQDGLRQGVDIDRRVTKVYFVTAAS